MRVRAAQLELFATTAQPDPLPVPPSIPQVSARADTPLPFSWDGFEHEPSGAWFTGDRAHRVLLWRSWSGQSASTEHRAVFVMLNPSAAGAVDDDPTIRRCAGFARGWGCGGFCVANLYTLIATDPKRLWTTDPEDRLAAASELAPHARDHCDVYAELRERCNGPIVLAWGVVPPTARERVKDVLDAFDGTFSQCLGTTQAGHPRHPLYLASDTRLEAYSGH